MTNKFTPKELNELATKLLKESGYTWNGAKRNAISYQQDHFERRMIPTGFRGASRKGKA